MFPYAAAGGQYHHQSRNGGCLQPSPHASPLTWHASCAAEQLSKLALQNLLKLGHLRRAAAAADPGAAAAAPPVSSFWPWQLGAALFAVGNLLNFVSFGESMYLKTRLYPNHFMNYMSSMVSLLATSTTLIL